MIIERMKMDKPKQIRLTFEQALEYIFDKQGDLFKKLAEYEKDPRPQSQHSFNCECQRCIDFYNEMENYPI